MNQQVNLYLPIFRRQKKILSALTIVQISSIFLLVFCTIYIYGEIRLNSFEGQLIELESNLGVLSEEVTKLQRQATDDSGSQLLENEIARLTNELSNRQRIQGLLSNRILGNTNGLSAYLEVIARQHVQGTWLTSISIAEGGAALSLKGRTLTSELVPVYLDRLATESLLNGMSFNVLEMIRPEDPSNYFEFLVSTN